METAQDCDKSNQGYFDGAGNPLGYNVENLLEDFEAFGYPPEDPATKDRMDAMLNRCMGYPGEIRRLLRAYEAGMKASTPLEWPGTWLETFPGPWDMARYYRDWFDLSDEELARAVGDPSEGEYARSVERLCSLREAVATLCLRKRNGFLEDCAKYWKLTPEDAITRMAESGYQEYGVKGYWPENWDGVMEIARRIVSRQQGILTRRKKKDRPKAVPSDGVPTTFLDVSKVSFERDKLHWRMNPVLLDGREHLVASSEFGLGRRTEGLLSIRMLIVQGDGVDATLLERRGRLVLGLGDNHLLDTLANMVTARGVKPLKGGHLPFRAIGSDEDLRKIYKEERPPTLFRMDDVWREFCGQRNSHANRPTAKQLESLSSAIKHLSMIEEEMVWTSLDAVDAEGREVLQANDAMVTVSNVDTFRALGKSRRPFLSVETFADANGRRYISVLRMPLRYIDAVAMKEVQKVPEAILIPPNLERDAMSPDAVRIANDLGAWNDGGTEVSHSSTYQTVGLAHWVAQTVTRGARSRRSRLEPVRIRTDLARELWEASTDKPLDPRGLKALTARIAQDIVNLAQYGLVTNASWLEANQEFEVAVADPEADE